MGNSKLDRFITYIWHLPSVQRFISDKFYIKLQYKNFINKKLDLINPQTFNEKLQWLKLYNRNSLYTKLVDKYEVRNYIAKIIGEEYLIPLIGVWNEFEDIDFNKLPNQFVLKPNHTSGDIFICKDKSKIDYNELEKVIKKWLKKNYYWVHREWPYKNIKPKIICEKYMVDESLVELKDYKFMCFNGEPKVIQVMSNRNKGHYHINHYDLKWNKINVSQKKYKENLEGINKPVNLDEMIKLSKRLSRETVFSRIDLYSIKEKIYFGEITFYPVSGYVDFDEEKSDYMLGSWINIS